MTTLLIMSSITTTLSWINMSSNNPMNSSLLILLMAITLSLMFSLTLSSWFALILFLIYIGGMMVMFSYFISLNSNDLMNLKNSIHMFIIPMLLIKNLNLSLHLSLFSASQLTLLYSMPNTIILLMLTIFLLMMMIIVTKMVKTNNGPLRGFTHMQP